MVSGKIFFWYQWSYSLTVSETNAPVGWNFALVWHPLSHSRPRFSWLGNCQTIGPVGLHTLNTMSVLLCLAECACIVERTSNVACSSNVLVLLGDLVLMMAAWWIQCFLLLCKLSPTAWSSIWLQDQCPSSAAGSSVTPNAPPLAFTTAFACARAWSIIIGENCRLDLCTIIFQFRNPEPSEVVSVESYCLCSGQAYTVHNLHRFRWIRMVSARSVTDSTDWSCLLE